MSMWDLLLGMSAARQDRQQWAAARTLPELGQLVAAWLHGGMIIGPGGRRYNPNPETFEGGGLAEVLFLLNQAGFVTENSQPGVDGQAYDGRQWQQIAAVDGFADDHLLRQLDQALRGTGVHVLAHPVNTGWQMFARRGVNVSWHDGAPVCSFGDQRNRKQIARDWRACSDEMIDVLCGVWQVTIYDPQVGSNDLWPLLGQLFTGSRKRRRR